jgi:putative Mn2+ efflux pump MntP
MERQTRQRRAYALGVIGFILIVLNAVEHVGGFFGLSLGIRTSMVVGIILVMLGMFAAKEKDTVGWGKVLSNQQQKPKNP